MCKIFIFCSKVLKFGGPNPGRNLYGFWVDPWFRASKNTSKLLNTGLPAGKSIAENPAGKLKGGNFVRKSSAHRNFQGEFRGNNLRDLTKPYKTYMSQEKNPPTFRCTAWFTGSLILAYQNPHIISLGSFSSPAWGPFFSLLIICPDNNRASHRLHDTITHTHKLWNT